MKRYILIVTALLAFASTAYAQRTIRGSVISATDNMPMVGVTVIAKGFAQGTVTDWAGSFELPVPISAGVIVFSMVGYQTLEVHLNGRTQIDVRMTEDMGLLDEVVVIGYGSVRKGDLTSSIASVKGEDLQNMTSGNAMKSLQGKVNGVQITNEGGPGATPRVIIRGVTTVNGSDPLYVVDGVPMGTNINFLAQDDIERIDVLKDASAAAIYGTRGSNGVVLVTTRKGVRGKTKFQFSTWIGLQTIGKPDMAGAAEYEQVFKTRYTNDGNQPVWNGKDGYTDAEGTDWWDEVVRPAAMIQNYSLGFQGGNEKILFSGSVSYFRQDSNFEYGYWDKLTARFNMEYLFNDVVKAGIDFVPRYESWDNTPTQFQSAMSMDPTTPVFLPLEERGDNVYDNFSRSRNNQVWNPVATIARMDQHNDEYGLVTTPWVSVEPLKGLILKTQFAANVRIQQQDQFNPRFWLDNLEQQNPNTVQRQMNKYVDWNWTSTLNYSASVAGKHNIGVMAGFTMEKFADYSLWGYRENTPSNLDALRYVSAGTRNQQSSGLDVYDTLVSYLGRFTYNYDRRYYLTASVRVDGSSKFPTGNKYATFPAVSAAWAVSNEAFMKNQNVVSNLKLRAGWGQVGNQNIDRNAYLTLLGGVDYVFGTGADRFVGTNLTGIGNNTLHWETVEDVNIGVDLGLLNNRLTVVAEWFTKKSHDMLLQRDNILALGYPMYNGQMWANVGSMKATGWELSLGWSDHVKDFSYELGLNLSSVRNKALTLLGEQPMLKGSFNNDYIIRNEEGGEISRFYGYIADGIFQNRTEVNAHTGEHGEVLQPSAQPGDIRFRDTNHDGVLDAADKVYLGSAFPDLMIGFNASFAYKNWDMSANFYGTIGNDIYNTSRNMYSGSNGLNVWSGTARKAWHGEGTSNSIPRLSVNDLNPNYARVSSFYVEDGSYFKCQLLQLGYTIPKSLTKSVGIRISLSAQNLFTITGYSGMDPERAAMGSVTEAGIDQIGYPNPRTFLCGINLTF